MPGLRLTYLILAVIGAVWPMWHLLTYLFGETGTLPGMVALWIANDATRGLTADLLVTGTALIVWIVAETMLRKNRIALVAIPATLLVGPSFGLPLYLFLRSRPTA